MNKEQCHNKVSDDIKPSTYKETESIIYETNVSDNRYDELGSEPIFKAESYIKYSNGNRNNQDNTVFQRKKENSDKVISNVRKSKLANKKPTNSEDSHNIKSKEYNNDSILIDKEKKSKKYSTKDQNNDNVKKVEAATQIKSDINENKNNLLFICDHDIYNYNHYKNNNKKHNEKYIESSIKNNENNTDAKAKIVNNPLTYQTNTNQINVDNDKLEQDVVGKKN